MAKYIGYIRVSTEEQGRPGLGLEAPGAPGLPCEAEPPAVALKNPHQ
jgi:hypothetical protein